METNLFNLIESDQLTKAKLDSLVAAGTDPDEPNEKNESILDYACRLEKYDVIQLLLGDCKEYEDEDFDFCYHGRAYEVAYSSKNVHLLAFILKIAALDSDLTEVISTPVENDTPDISCYYTGAQYFDQSDAYTQQIIENIKTRIKLDTSLQNHPELLELINTINYVSLAMNRPPGNAEDQIDCTIVELTSKGITHRFEYFTVSNWSMGLAILFLKWKTLGQERPVLDLNTDAYECILEEYAMFRMLAVEMGIGHLSFDVILKFFTLILSRTLQLFDTPWRKHPLLGRLNSTFFEEARFLKNPISDLTLY